MTVKNISFTSAMVIKGAPKQVRGIDLRMNREAWTVEQRNEITHINPTWPMSQHISRFDFENDIYYAAARKEYPTGNIEIGLPRGKFAYCMVKIKDGPTDADSVYLFATGQEAKLLERINIAKDTAAMKLDSLRAQLSKARNQQKQNDLLESLKTYGQGYRDLSMLFEKFMGRYRNEIPISARQVLSAISKKSFNFETLSFVGKTLFLKG